MTIIGPDSGYLKKAGLTGSGKSDKSAKSAKASASASSVSKEAGSASGDASTKIAVSELGKEVAKIHDQIKTSPDVRVEKVQELKDKIEDGTYYISSDKIAGKIIEDIVKQG